MFKRFTRLIKTLTVRRKGAPIRPVPPGTHTTHKLTGACTHKNVNQLLAKSFDILFRDFYIEGKEKIAAHLICVDGMVNKEVLNDFVLKTLMIQAQTKPVLARLTLDNALETVFSYLLATNEVRKENSLASAVDSILSGDAALFFGDQAGALIIGSRGWENRGVQEPVAESVVRGPREGFSETVRVNTSLLRRKIKSPDFVMKPLKVGELTRTDIVIAYIQGVANDKILRELENRLSAINIDGVLESGYIEELIEDVPYSPFPQVYHTERPDVVAAEILEGKIAVLVDGTPFTLVVPGLFIMFLQVSEDYYERPYTAILVRLIRLIGVLIALLLPSLYIALTTFHQEMIPTFLALSIASGRDGVPVPAVIEALEMEVTLEILREAGLRLPRPIGQAIGIVGALVIGDAAVSAGLVSPIMVIIVSLTAIASFTTPSFNMGITIRLLRFPLMLAASTLGFFGISLFFYGLLLHLCSLRSFGIPYFSPFGPGNLYDLLKDTVVRSPWWAMRTRPRMGAKTSAEYSSSGSLKELEEEPS
ncbi:MAG TPA: spore germination protein [Verrucomicrobiae bacterium]|nr:spore germination protein [Verrucomicrobiae bacterium]